jgi:hypothetical protein
MYFDNNCVEKTIKRTHKVSVIIGIVGLLLELLLIQVVFFNENLHLEASVIGIVLFVVVILFIDIVYIMIFRYYFFKIIMKVELCDDTIKFLSFKKKYVISAFQEIRTDKGIFGESVRIILVLNSGKTIRLYALKTHIGWAKNGEHLDNINYDFIHKITQ